MSKGKLYGILVLMFVIAFVIIILRSSLQGLQWTPFLNNYLPKTRPALLYLSDIVQYALMVVLIAVGIIALVFVQRRTSKSKK
ncbi:MAG: hypothetical protein ABSA50_05800 [Candidatus Bathyarchaeia archaeon]|jgi:small-conductance mechanosensitive channel